MKEYIDNLNKILQYKEDIKQSIISKGQTVGDSLCEYSFAIDNINAAPKIPEILDTDPLTFVRVDNSGLESSISLNNVGTPANKPFEYNKNDEGWKTYTIGTNIPMNYGDKLQFRSNTYYGMNNTISEDNYRQFKTLNGMYKCGGQLISLTNNVHPYSTGVAHYCSFRKLFAGTNILQTPIYNNISANRRWFESMFENCNLLYKADKIRTPSGIYAYSYMFSGCTSLVNAPELPATTLTSNCYSSMFRGCTSLVNAPELPATTLASGCYSSMFQGCTSLVNAPELPATTLASSCYSSMFYGCTSLVNAPELPATTLASGCYSSMFNGCININTIKAMCMYSSGTTLITSSIGSSWLGATSLTGTFYKNPNWTGPTSRSSSTIPTNWQIVDWIQ